MIGPQDIITLLDLAPHPEGGWYKETFRDEAGPDGRPMARGIFFLLEGGQESAWHSVDEVEVWQFYDGAPMVLQLALEDRPAITLVLGNDLDAGERPQWFVPAGCWQSAKSQGDWSLVGCTVAQGFEFEGFDATPARSSQMV
ncbi:MAG: cupin domain-containing protein [Caulobacter sp.]|nr:cupin domain-containing protein [Caulobacter sp.]